MFRALSVMVLLPCCGSLISEFNALCFTPFVENYSTSITKVNTPILIASLLSMPTWQYTLVFFQFINQFSLVCSGVLPTIIGFCPQRSRLYNCMNLISMTIKRQPITIPVSIMSSDTVWPVFLMRHQSVTVVDRPGLPAVQISGGIDLRGWLLWTTDCDNTPVWILKLP